MRHTSSHRKLDRYGNIISDAEEHINQMLTEAAEVGPQLLKDEEEEIETEDVDDDIDIESTGEELDSAIEGEEEEEVVDDPIQPEINTQQTMQVVSLEDVKALLQSIIGQQATPAPAPTVEAGGEVVSIDNTAVNDQKGLIGGEEALKAVYFQGEGNETLDSEFDFTSDSAAALESKVEDEESYLDAINGLPIAYADFEDVAQAGAAMPKAADAGAHVYGGSTTYSDMDGGDYCNPTMARLQNAGNDFDIDGTSEFAGEEDELLMDGEGEPEPEDLHEDAIDDNLDAEELEAVGHPDLHRIVGPIEFDDEEAYEDDFIMPDVDEYIEAPVEEEPAPVTTKGSVNIGGQQVQIILTGVMITPAEMNYIGEAVSKAGNKLKAINGQANRLQIVVESKGNKYVINYVDAPKVQEPTPFSINNYKFTTLNEALGRINEDTVAKTAKVFKKVISESMSQRSINEFKEADIFEGLSENVTYTGTWTVKPVGSVNLKNGLNETYSNIIQHGKEPNTLVKTNDGNYYLLKGNLKERSKVGTKKELYDMKGKNTYGVAEVVGIYENTSAGLGKIMEKLKRTSIPMFVWK